MIELRPYQFDVVGEIERKIAAGRKGLIVVAPTGSGKTVIASEIIRRSSDALKRTVFIAHRDELLVQARDKLKYFGIDAGIVKAGRDNDARPQALVQVCGIQTLHARAFRSKCVQLPPAELLIIDEAHHARARTYQTLIEAYPDATLIGLTATPVRGDGRGLGNVFEDMIECPQIPQLIEGGYLVKCRIFAPPAPDLRGVKVASTGDYDIGQLSTRMDPLVGDFVEHWLKHAERRRTIAFAVDIKHSVHIVEELGKSGVRAEHLDGATSQVEREAILARLASGQTEVIANCQVLTEGFDCPDIGCIALVRPTRSLGLFRQMIGRGLRPADGKADVIILDHSGGVHRHGRPDDRIKWTLATDKRASNPAHEARLAANGSDPWCDCPSCGELRLRGAACDHCGWQPHIRGRGVEYVDGVLALIDGKPATTEMADQNIFYRELRGYQDYARRRDGSPYARGWAAQQFRTKFGHFPPWPWNDHAPIEPSPATLRWIKSRRIAWVKARGAA